MTLTPVPGRGPVYAGSIFVLGNMVGADDVVRKTEHNEFQRLFDAFVPRTLIRPFLQRNGIGILDGTDRKIFEEGITERTGAPPAGWFCRTQSGPSAISATSR
jgi:hypothetical protein